MAPVDQRNSDPLVWTDLVVIQDTWKDKDKGPLRSCLFYLLIDKDKTFPSYASLEQDWPNVLIYVNGNTSEIMISFSTTSLTVVRLSNCCMGAP